MVPSSIGKKRLSQEGNFNNIVSEESSEGKGLPQASASPPLPDISTMPMTTRLPVHICSSPCRLTSATLLLLLTASICESTPFVAPAKVPSSGTCLYLPARAHQPGHARQHSSLFPHWICWRWEERNYSTGTMPPHSFRTSLIKIYRS